MPCALELGRRGRSGGDDPEHDVQDGCAAVPTNPDLIRAGWELAAVPGDLLVDVHVLPEPRDPRVVRYLAAALFVAALVALLLYLV